MLLNVKEMDIQLEEEIRMNSRSRGKGCMTMRRCSNCNELRHNVRICKKDEKMFNIYSFK